MPKYTANAYLVHKGVILQTGEELEFSVEQAERLGEKVTLVEREKEEYTEASLKKLSAEEQKAVVIEKGGNLEKLRNEEKRIAFILENQ